MTKYSFAKSFWKFVALSLFGQNNPDSQEELQELRKAEARIAARFPGAYSKIAEMDAEGRKLGIKFSDHVPPSIRAAIIDHLKNPYSPSDVQYMHLTWVTPIDGQWNGSGSRRLLSVMTDKLHQDLARADGHDRGRCVSQYLQFEQDVASLKPGQSAILGGPHEPVRSRIRLAAKVPAT